SVPNCITLFQYATANARFQCIVQVLIQMVTAKYKMVVSTRVG
ncbi:20800_t:CDS:1, partial [Dentiscutata erythropus]